MPLKPYENISIVRQGIYRKLRKTDSWPAVHQAAVAWSHDRPCRSFSISKARWLPCKTSRPNRYMVATVPPGNPKLRIVKLASTPDAKPGEEVWFTIRFDNIGNQTIGNVTIIDSLSTRLEYVEGSAQCSREADILHPAQRRRLARSPLRTCQSAGSGQRRHYSLLLPSAVDVLRCLGKPRSQAPPGNALLPPIAIAVSFRDNTIQIPD